MESEDFVRLIQAAQSPWTKLMLVVAFYAEPGVYGLDSRTGARQVGRAAPIDRDLGAVARAIWEAPSR